MITTAVIITPTAKATMTIKSTATTKTVMETVKYFDNNKSNIITATPSNICINNKAKSPTVKPTKTTTTTPTSNTTVTHRRTQQNRHPRNVY